MSRQVDDPDGPGPGRFDPSIRTGLGRLLVFLYAVFAVGTVSRSVVQIATVFDEARLAYALSAVSALIYVVATIGLIVGLRGLAVAACAFEFVGVLVVGTLTVADAAAFPDQTVWSDFGKGYLFIPVVLPLVGLWWLLRRRRTTSADPLQEGEHPAHEQPGRGRFEGGQ